MKTIINDTCDIVATRLSDGKVIFIAEANLASISTKLQEDKVKAGIGNKTITVLRSDKEIDLTVRSAIFDPDFLEIVTGNTFSSATNTVYKKAENLTATATGTLSFAGATPVTGSIKVIDNTGNQLSGSTTYATGAFSNSNIVNGSTYTVIYQESVTGNTLTIDATKFPSNFKIEYHTVEYSLINNSIVKDLYIQFDNCLPSGTFDISYENGKMQTPELKLMALVGAGTTQIGRFIEATRP